MRRPSASRNPGDENLQGDALLRSLERRARTGDLAAASAWGAAARRAGYVTFDTAELLDTLGPEAWLAWIKEEDWEWQPEDVESGDPNGPDCHDDRCPVHYGTLDVEVEAETPEEAARLALERVVGRPVLCDECRAEIRDPVNDMIVHPGGRSLCFECSTRR